MKRFFVIAALLALGLFAGYRSMESGPMHQPDGWDFVFLVCYGLLLAIGGSVVSQRLEGRWESWSTFAAFASLVAATLDAVEKTLLLHALEGRVGAVLVSIAEVLKLTLLVPAAVIVLAGVAVALFRSLAKKDDGPLPSPRPVLPNEPERLKCDVVMKGGITSGIVYPRAIARLARKYDFVCVGGASAGAIAAAATAAAAYARANGRDGFSVLEKLPEWLGKNGRLFKLFQPNSTTRAPFETFVAFLGHAPLPFKLARAFAVGAWHFPIAFALGLLPAWFLGSGAFATAAPAWGVTGALATAFVCAPIVILLGFVLTLFWALPKNFYGMCSGRIDDNEEVLSTWLDGLLSNLAGIEGRPLIFADLWTAGEEHRDLDAMRDAARLRLPGDRKINFEALTTSLVHCRPFRLPELGAGFYFRKDELERVLPKSVVKWMVDHARQSELDVPEEYVALPEAHDLPVVFAARLSLSFPVLISAVPLWGVDWRRPENKARRNGGTIKLDVCWMSDGGISSNFPIHFFDTLMPSRPTFGLDLALFHVDRKRDPDEAKNVFLPTNNRQGFSDNWQHFQGLKGFCGALVNSLQAYLDNMQARAPGFRDRIARIHLDESEGGLNLIMPAEVLHRIGERGAAAGDKLVQRFVNETPSGWENHRWVRLRLLLGRIDPLLRDLAGKELPPLQNPPSYAWESKAQEALADDVVTGLVALGARISASNTNLEDGEPNPRPVLRTLPRV